jgi:hypothetical protein
MARTYCIPGVGEVALHMVKDEDLLALEGLGLASRLEVGELDPQRN